MKKLCTNWGYSSFHGKDIEEWDTLCDSCLSTYELHKCHDYKITEAVPMYEGHILRCGDCGKTEEDIKHEES